MPRRIHDPFAASRIQAAERPEPPSYLPEDAADEWRAIVNRMPPDWFPRETHAMLEQFCRLVIYLRGLNSLRDSMMKKKKININELNTLNKMIQQQGRLLISYSSNMRLSQQSSIDKARKKGAVAARKVPWQEAAE